MATADRLIAAARAEVGYLEKRSAANMNDKGANAGSGNFTKYGAWFGWNGVAWCHIFVSWCASAAGCASIIPRTASCYEGRDWFAARGRLIKRGAGTPKPGDIVYFSSQTYPSGGAHVGIVTGFDGKMLYTVEGNTSSAAGVQPNGGAVAAKSYAITYNKIYGFGRPDYEEDDMTEKQVRDIAQDEISKARERYDSIEECPAWAQETVRKLVDKGIVQGEDGGRLGLTYDLMRLLVINDRAGLYDK